LKESAYEKELKIQFSMLEFEKFKVNMFPPKIFVCGGSVDTGKLIPQSLRERIKNHLYDNNRELFNALVMAESFVDYFKDGAYSNLLQFEDDIANISTLIIICLESAGSLVEFGMFCNKKEVQDKLLVYVSSEEVATKNSFIFLGPLQDLKNRSIANVATYPFPSPDIPQYDEIELVIHDLENRLDSVRKHNSFDSENSGHLALLIYEIITLAEPIKLTEIKLALIHLRFDDITTKDITRLLYLLEKLSLIGEEEYSTVPYYYAIKRDLKRLSFGSKKNGGVFNRDAAFMAIRQSFIPFEKSDEVAKKRYYVTKRINLIRDKA
jgi:hypothetical protein